MPWEGLFASYKINSIVLTPPKAMKIRKEMFKIPYKTSDKTLESPQAVINW